MRRDRRRDGGVTIVEAAFALPILFMFILGLADLGMWTFNANQATNAARDGARAAIIDHRFADDPTSETFEAVVERIESRLAGRSLTVQNVAIDCVRADGGTGCEGAHPDRDQIRVRVDWSWDLITPIAAVIGVDKGNASGVATMTIVGKAGDPPPVDPPSTTTSTSTTTTTSTSTIPPAPCDITGILVTPSPATLQGSSGALNALEIKFTATGEGCTGLAVQLSPPNSQQVQSATCKTCGSTSNTWLYDSNDKVWSTGCASVRIFNANVDTSATFRVGSAATCPA